MRLKSIFLMALVAVAMLTVSCNSCKNGENGEKEVITSLNYDQIVKADFDSLTAIYPECNFYEAQVWFDSNINLDRNPNVTNIITVFQNRDTCIMCSHFLIDGERCDTINKIADYWLEDVKTTPYTTVSLDSAITCLKNANVVVPESDFVVLRRPLYPPFPENSYYIFGTFIYCVAIDAETGKVVDNCKVGEIDITGIFKEDK